MTKRPGWSRRRWPLRIALLAAGLVAAGLGFASLSRDTVANPLTVEPERAAVSGVARAVPDRDASGGGYLEFGRTDTSPGVTVSGNRLFRNGAPWSPRGFTLVGALSPSDIEVAGVAHAHLDDKEMQAAKSWGADALRFQVSQRGLDPQDSLYSNAYVERVRQAVALARRDGFAVILSIQDQRFGEGARHPQPGPATLRDFETLTPMFNGDLEVMYEMFNEPYNQPGVVDWTVWRDGGPPEGNLGDAAVGHQAVLDAIRASGSRNVVIADGAQYARNLTDIPLLKDPLGQVAYGVHPYFDGVDRDPTHWDSAFGYLAASVPVIATEWNVHSSSPNCDAAGPGKAERLLDYLADRNIGLFAWALDWPGTLIADWDYRPTTLKGFVCDPPDPAGKGVRGGYGAGEVVRDRYRTAGPVPAGCPKIPGNEGESTATVDVPVAGTYRVWSRLRTQDAPHGTFWVQVDKNCPLVIEGRDGAAAAGGVFTWHEADQPLHLGEGRREIRMIGRDGGVKLDRVLFLADGCDPTGTGDNCSP